MRTISKQSGESESMAKALKAKQRMFAREYLRDSNGTQAAIRAGYSKKTAQEQASRLMKNPLIRELICESTTSIAEDCQLDRSWLLTELRKNYDLAMGAGRFGHAIQILGMIEKHLSITSQDESPDGKFVVNVVTGLGPFTPGSGVPGSPYYPDFVEKVREIRHLYDLTSDVELPSNDS